MFAFATAAASSTGFLRKIDGVAVGCLHYLPSALLKSAILAQQGAEFFAPLFNRALSAPTFSLRVASKAGNAEEMLPQGS
ncbi:hypothetical protein MAMC_01275 [Methylacidimicrobium cyclopophantes]|uniref:Uncharacterized protein n=1 Tax=Methylacidimicrobium cyclopophantes TaxID=1041766 RepID=A0A5E6MEM8_9BACT|nr:hypothetical protein MAMC_01275 [Methylacidimicrobium cyclopophantes]